MSDFTVHAANVATPAGRLSKAGVRVRDGVIVEVHPSSDADGAQPSSGSHGWLLPGFIDTQVNGGGGVLFNDDPSVETIRRIGDAHARFGTTAFLPTLISDDLSVVDAGMRAVERAIAQGVPGVAGIHIEGPFLSVARKGIHDPTKFRRLDDAAIALLGSLAVGRTLVTLAPEHADAEHITRLTRAGVVVAAGHTDADYARMRVALDAGVTGFTGRAFVGCERHGTADATGQVFAAA